MAHQTPDLPMGQSDKGFDLSQIFIGRQQQLDLFEIYLKRWKQLILSSISDETPENTAPTPDNKIEGLVVLLFGRGGFGKSTLLKHYRALSLQDGWNLTTSKIVDWEFAVEGKRSLFNPPQWQQLDAAEYFKVLCGQLAFALDKEPRDFKAYQSTVKDVEKSKKEASNVLDAMQKDDRYGWLRGLTIEIITSAVSTYVPGSKAVVENKQVQDAASAVGKLTQEQIAQVYTRLHTKLGNKLVNYLEPSLRLGLALGSDLRVMARNYPLLIFFDTYEEADEGDRLLRMIMGAAGIRVGWVIAGRDNLWAGSEQRERSVEVEYGYKEIVQSDRGLSINFNAGDVGTFTLSDIAEYFALVRKKVSYQPSLPIVTEEQSKRILDITQGVPLAVKIAAGLYLETANLEMVTEHVKGKRTIVDQMVRRYLLHTHSSMEERTRLYGLALLRLADQPKTIAAALGLTPEQARTSYRSELSRLHRRYSFIFTEKELPALHQEVRYFLRLWLQEHCKEPEIISINERLEETYENALKHLEEQLQYSTLKERLQDDEWTGIYLDLTEQQFWLDPVKGVCSALPFMIAAAIYRRDINEDAANIGKFFEQQIRQPYRNWWTWATHSLVYTTNRNSSLEGLTGLGELVKLASQRCPTFPQPIPDYRTELETALWWRFGEAHRGQDDNIALEWYEKALTRLSQQPELREEAAETALSVTYKLYEEQRYFESIDFLNKAITLKPDYVRAYENRGFSFMKLHEFQRAIADLNHTLQLDPNFTWAYIHRGASYRGLKEYQQAIADLNSALKLDSNLDWAYCQRAYTFTKLKDYQQAIADIDHAIELNPTMGEYYYIRGLAYLWLRNVPQARDNFRQGYELASSDVDAAWMSEWVCMSKWQPGMEDAIRLESIAAIEPENYVAYVCRGVALGLEGKVKEGLEEVEKAILLDPQEWDSYFWKGMLLAYYYRKLPRASEVMSLIEQSLTAGLPPQLLIPLYWLEKDLPDLFVKYAKPLLLRYDV